MRSRVHHLAAAVAILAVAGITADRAALGSEATAVAEGGIFRVSLNTASGLDFVDPALASSPAAWAVLDTMCARLMSYPDKPPPAGFQLQPEVAAAFPAVSRDGKTYTFRLRSGFRFSDGSPVRASAFARAINRVLAPEMRSPGLLFVRDVVGAGQVVAGKARTASGVVARGQTLVVRLTRPVPDFPSRMAATFFCAVPPSLPIDPEGVGAFHAAGPYTVVDYRRGELVQLRRNRFYGGARPHHVDGFDVDLRVPSPQEVLRRVERGEADWGHTLSGIYFDPALGLLDRYGLNRSQLSLKPGLTLRILAFNSARPLFRDNPQLRKAVNFALDRRALVLAGGQHVSRPTDQYLPPTVPGFKDADVYPLERPDLQRAKELAEGSLRSGKAVLYVNSSPLPMAIGQLVRQQLGEIGLDVEVRGIPIHSASSAYFNKLATPGEPWDIAFGLWTPSYIDPYAYINLLFDRRFVGATNFARFASSAYDKQMRNAARLPQGRARRDAYSTLDVQLARGAAPGAGIDELHQPTPVTRRGGGGVLRPAPHRTPPLSAWSDGRHGAWAVTQTNPAATAIPAGALPISIVATTSFDSVSIRDTVLEAVFATQTDPADAASAVGPSPTRIVSAARDSGSIRLTIPSPELATQTAPSAATIPDGRVPTLTVSTGATEYVLGLNRCAFAPPEFATQIASSRTTMPAGCVPARPRPTTLPALSSCARVESPNAAHTDPAPTATLPYGDPKDVPPAGVTVVTCPNCGSTRETSPRTPCATQIAPRPTAIPVGVRFPRA
jgi:peptide/nickel transport system substrate-binding protein